MASGKGKGKRKQGRTGLIVPADDVPVPGRPQVDSSSPQARRIRERALTIRTAPPQIDPDDLSPNLASDSQIPMGLDISTEDLESEPDFGDLEPGDLEEELDFGDLEDVPTVARTFASSGRMAPPRSMAAAGAGGEVRHDTVQSRTPVEGEGQSIEIPLDDLSPEELVDDEGPDDRPIPSRPASALPPPPPAANAATEPGESWAPAPKQSRPAPKPSIPPPPPLSSSRAPRAPKRSKEESPPPPPLPPVPRFPTPDDASRDKKRDEPVDGEGAHAVADEGHPAPEEAVARPSTDDIEPAPIDDTLPTYGKARATPEPHRIEAKPDHEDAGELEPAPSPVTGEETPEPADTRTVQPATGADEEPPDASSDRATDADAPARPSPIPAPAADGSGVVIVGRIHVIGTGGPSLSPEARVRRGAAAEAMVREPEVADVAARVQVDEDAEELDLSEAEEIRDSHDSIEIETEVAESAAPPSEAEIGSIPPPPPPGKASKPAPAPAPAAASAPAARPTPPPPEKPGRTTASRRRHKPWWDEMFNDDYLRSLPAYSARFTQKEVDFIESALGVKSNGMILDLACGNGRHAVELSNRGYQIVGLDLSLAMLARAAELAQKNNQKINFIHGDMREMAFESTFDGAIFLGTSFGYFDDDTNVKVIEGLWRALKTKGTVIIETANRDYLISRQPNMVWFEGDGCVCMEESSFNYITSRLIVKRSLLFDDGRQLEHEFSIRVYCLHEIGKVLHNAGFRVAEVSGHIHTPSAFFGPESTNLIILAEKRESKKS